MSEQDEQRQRGAEMMAQVYGSQVMTPPEAGKDPFFDIMLESVFANVWPRPGFDIRERRLLTIGVIAALGETMPFKIQIGAALRREEMTPDQVRELIIHLAPYIGYPRVGGMKIAAEEAIGEYKKELKAQQKGQDQE